MGCLRACAHSNTGFIADHCATGFADSDAKSNRANRTAPHRDHVTHDHTHIVTHQSADTHASV
jgi:hypothetical protein